MKKSNENRAMKQENTKIISKDQYEEYMEWIDMNIFRENLSDDEILLLDRIAYLVLEYEREVLEVGQ